VNRNSGSFNRDSRDTRGDVRIDNPEFNPFESCIKLVETFYDEVVTEAESGSSRWARLFRVHNKTWVFNEDSRDILQLVKHLSDETDATCKLISEEDTAVNRISSAKVTRNRIKETIRNFKVHLLGHPINIILSAFMVKEQDPVFDYDRKNDAPRTARGFLESFPYEYLAGVYKQAFDYVVRMATVCVSPQTMLKDEENVQTFTRKARQDVERVCFYKNPLCLLVFNRGFMSFVR